MRQSSRVFASWAVVQLAVGWAPTERSLRFCSGAESPLPFASSVIRGRPRARRSRAHRRRPLARRPAGTSAGTAAVRDLRRVEPCSFAKAHRACSAAPRVDAKRRGPATFDRPPRPTWRARLSRSSGESAEQRRPRPAPTAMEPRRQWEGGGSRGTRGSPVFMEPTGLEPVTFWLPAKRSPS